MKRVIFVLLIAMLMGACQAVQAAPVATATPAPSPTPTLVPLSDIDLSAVIAEPGDLPTGYTLGQYSDQPESPEADMPTWVQVYNVDFVNQGVDAGAITIYLFENVDDAKTAYEMLTESDVDDYIKFGPVEELGEVAQWQSLWAPMITGLILQYGKVDFVRCHAVVEVYVSDTSDTQGITIYAQHLDERLQTLVCR